MTAALPAGITWVGKQAIGAWRANKAFYPENQEYKDAHAGETCYIVCNGPSIARQDLRKLAGNIVFSVSNGYRHEHYSIYHPQYHCLPQVAREKLSEQDIVKWFEEMDNGIGDAVLFLSDTERELVDRHGLFRKRKVSYLRLSPQISLGDARCDISRSIPRPQSAPILCIMIALYMGFKNIVLLGVDHDFFLSGEYKYFYGEHSPVLRGKLGGVDGADRVTDDRYTQFCELKTLWEQYLALRKLANKRGVNILNATDGGALDVFPRISLDEAIQKL
ncbi:hypothetical protein [Alcanivorax sp.]|uniref:hypothetical protein n=1 Tax=Alcanivorax sp. TaxID=1872427 RepID=UPI00258D606C|nr:hypothetical protein [Alcanivorax sp.]